MSLFKVLCFLLLSKRILTEVHFCSSLVAPSDYDKIHFSAFLNILKTSLSQLSWILSISFDEFKSH